jgi:hypothetical protein
MEDVAILKKIKTRIKIPRKNPKREEKQIFLYFSHASYA